MRILTRVCLTCRRRKPLREFWQQANPTKRYGAQCHTCRPEVLAPRKTKRCRACGVRKYLRCFTSHNCSKDGLEYRCKACIKKYNRVRRPKAGGLCMDCGKPSHFRRCEACRVQFQVAAEAIIQEPHTSLTMCALPTRRGACPERLLFGVDRLGCTVMWCRVHGERLMPTSGVRHHDQRSVLEDEIEAFVERGKRKPEPTVSASVNGMHFRRQSRAYTHHPWQQVKRAVA